METIGRGNCSGLGFGVFLEFLESLELEGCRRECCSGFHQGVVLYVRGRFRKPNLKAYQSPKTMDKGMAQDP